MKKFKKPNGSVVEVNETSEQYAKVLGWTEVKEQQKAKPRGNSRKSD